MPTSSYNRQQNKAWSSYAQWMDESRENGGDTVVSPSPAGEGAGGEGSIAYLRGEIRRLQIELQKAHKELETYRSTLFKTELPQTTGTIINGRPVLTIAEAAKKVGVSYWIARRYVIDGWWEADFDQHSNYAVYADKPLTTRPKKTKSRR